MADTRVVAELIVQGAAKAIHEIVSVQSAQSQLVSVIESAGVRQRAVYDQVSVAAKQAAIAAEDAAKRQADAAQRAAESSTRAATQAARAATEARRSSALANITPTRAPTQIDALSRVSTAGGQELVGVLRQQAAAAEQVTQANTKKTKTIADQSNAEGRAKSSGISYLSTLSAIHAASFLATNRTFSLIGSFTTLGLAFSKLGPVAIAAGLGLGAFLGIFGAISNAAQQLQQALLATAQGLVTVVGVVGAAVTAASVAGVKIAADAEQSLAGLRAFGGATTEQLRAASQQAGELALRFGVSARDVLEAASLFSRAGGEVQDAINGATEAIIQLTVASAGEIQAAQAAIAVSQGIKAFKLEASDAIRVTNVLTGAAQASALSFTGVTQAFIQAAPGARNLGISIEDLGAAMALLGNELVKGTITGTAFKQFILDLIKPSKVAQEQFDKFGISIADANGKIRPLTDILGDLNKALGDEAVATGKVTDAARNRALVAIFESRAYLAASILTREGAQGLDDFRDKLEEVTASNIVNVLLLPLNKQLEILQVTVQEVGRAFGGSLLAPIRAVTVQAIDLFKQLIPAAQLAGQAVASIATGQGFEALQTKITDLVGNNQLSSFLIELVNMFRNVSDVIQNAIIPAIVDFGSRIGLVASESGRIDQVGTAFENINRSIQIVGAVVATLINRFAELLVQVIHNEGAGRTLRDTISNLATIIASRLITSLATSVAFMVITLKALDGIGRVIQESVLPNMSSFADGLITLAEVANATVDFVTLPFTSAARAAAFAGKIIEGAGIEEALNASAEAGRRAEPLIVKPLRAELDAARALGTALKGLSEGAKTGLNILDQVLEESRAGIRETVKVFEETEGQISDALANITAEVDQVINATPRGERGTVGAQEGVIDTKAIETAVGRVQELSRDLGRRLQNLNEDTTTRVKNILDKGLERVGDIFDKAKDQLKDLAKDAKDQITEIFENITQRRDDRRRLDDVKDQLDEETRLEQRRIDEVERLDEKALEQKRLLRQRDTEDNSRQLDEQLSDLERVLQKSQDASERGLREIQRVREDALKTTQDLEEKQLSRSLDAQATARREQQQLGEAKTPEDRARLQRQFAQTRADTQFSIGQQNQLDALKKKHEAQSRELQRSNEAQNLTLRASQEAQLLSLRKNNEKSLLLVRRNIEDDEIITRDKEDAAQLVKREQREIDFRGFRERQERTLRNFTDELENEAATRQAGKIITKAIDRAKEIEANAIRAALELETSINQQLDEQRQQLNTALRALEQTLQDFEENLTPDVRAAVSAPLNALKATLGAEKKVIDDAFEKNRAQTLSQIGTAIGAGQIDLTALQPNLTIPTTPVQVTPRQVIQASVIQAAQLIIGQAAAQQLEHALLNSLRQAGQEGTFDNPINLNPVVGAIQIGNQLLEQSRRMFGR